jgi:hypothetical protein
MPKIEDRIAALRGRLQQLEARKQQIAARRKALETRRQRTEDTRRKVLVGAIVLAKVEGGEFEKERLRGWLDEALTRPDDRALFDLPEKEK